MKNLFHSFPVLAGALLFLVGIMMGVLLQGMLAEPWAELFGGLVMAAMVLLSMILTPRQLREANGFTWTPILEVATIS